jgi:hypothetical protein
VITPAPVSNRPAPLNRGTDIDFEGSDRVHLRVVDVLSDWCTRPGQGPAVDRKGYGLRFRTIRATPEFYHRLDPSGWTRLCTILALGYDDDHSGWGTRGQERKAGAHVAHIS